MKIGVFVCHCGFNIAETVDIKKVLKEVGKEPNVVCYDHDYLCSDSGLNAVKERIKEDGLDRVVVASCTPKLHENLFRKTVEEAGLNRFLLEIANIREQCSWVHHYDPARATLKTIDLIKMAIEQAKYLTPLSTKTVQVEGSALVIGGGIAGITAALNLANAGIKVYLVERGPSIGGHMAMFDKVFPTLDCSICVLAPLMVEANQHPNISVMTYSEVKSVNGSIGNFEIEILKNPRYIDEEKCVGCYQTCTETCPVQVPNEFNQNIGTRKAIYVPFPQAVPLIPVIDEQACTGCRVCETACDREAINFKDEPKSVKIKAGAIIVATGYDVYDATRKSEYGYGRYGNVVTTLEFERILNPTGSTEGHIARPTDGKQPKRIAFIQCVGSRDEVDGALYCSRVCCMNAIKQAQEIKERIPDAEIYIFYQDIRAFGKGYEEMYRRALEKDRIRFIRGIVGNVIEDTKTKNLYLRVEDTLAGQPIEVEADLVVLSVGMRSSDGLDKLASLLNLARSSDGFLQEAHPKLRPSETMISGIYLAGCAQGPKDIQDTVSHAGEAAAKVIALLTKGVIEVDPITPMVSIDDCTGCGLCENACSYSAITINDKKATVREAACRGGGACAAACPVSAIDIPLFTDLQISSAIQAILKERQEYPLIIGFLCNWCGYAGADMAGVSRFQYPTNIRLVRVMCSARVSPLFALRALTEGADGVLIAGCYPQDCHYGDGFEKTSQRIDFLKHVLSAFGFDDKRIRLISVSASEGEKFAREVGDFVKTLSPLGPVGSEFEKGVKR
ncbi:MAG: CoB-CoM heterodisulfide reductase HdrA2 [Promethearchaeota archaeon]